ncbi:MAG: hypothetical protein NT154_17170 [Verrucomicrobia bacterium]|nr:hypothetical protein [Verrucomicrobiota bacterium]
MINRSQLPDSQLTHHGSYLNEAFQQVNTVSAYPARQPAMATGASRPQKDPQPPCQQQPSFDDSGWLGPQKDQPDDFKEANPNLLCIVQSAWLGGGGSAGCNACRPLAARQR